MQSFPRVKIEFCSGCKWNLRASWYAQELLQTFDHQLGEVAVSPSDPGCFKIWIQKSADSGPVLINDRKVDGFPDSKILKQKVRDVISPDLNLGHVDKTK